MKLRNPLTTKSGDEERLATMQMLSGAVAWMHVILGQMKNSFFYTENSSMTVEH